MGVQSSEPWTERSPLFCCSFWSALGQVGAGRCLEGLTTLSQHRRVFIACGRKTHIPCTRCQDITLLSVVLPTRYEHAEASTQAATILAEPL